MRRRVNTSSFRIIVIVLEVILPVPKQKETMHKLYVIMATYGERRKQPKGIFPPEPLASWRAAREEKHEH